MDRIADIMGKTNRRIVASAPYDGANISEIKQYVAQMTGIPEEEFVCHVVKHNSFHDYLVIFPDPLDLFIIFSKFYFRDGGNITVDSINGDESLGLSMVGKHDIMNCIFAGYAKAYMLSRELRAAKERIEEFECSPMPGPKFLAAQEHFAQFANIQKDKEQE